MKPQVRSVQAEVKSATGFAFEPGGPSVTCFEMEAWAPSSSVTVSATVGVAYLADRTGADLRDVLTTADAALLRAKRARKGSIELTVLD